MKILKRILKGPHEDLVRSLKILERFSPGIRQERVQHFLENNTFTNLAIPLLLVINLKR